MAIDAVERGKGQANRLHVGVNACSFAGGMWSPFVYRLFLSPHASSVVSSSSPVRGHFHPSFSAAIRPELPRALAAPALAPVLRYVRAYVLGAMSQGHLATLGRLAPASAGTPASAPASASPSEDPSTTTPGYDGGTSVTSNPNPNQCPPASRLLLDESRFLLDESRCLLDASRLLLDASRLLLRRRNPFTLRPKPFTLRRKPFTLRRQPLTLRRKPFTLRQKPVTLRREPFTLRRKPFTLRRKPFTLSSLHFLFTNALRRRRLRGLRSESPVRFPRLVFGAKKKPGSGPAQRSRPGARRHPSA